MQKKHEITYPDSFSKLLKEHPKCLSKILTTLPDCEPNGHHILYFLGNDTCVSNQHKSGTFKEIANLTRAVVIGFDYPNVGIAKGSVSSETVLINEGINQVNRLLEQGIAADHITLYGHSLGGAVATLVAAHFHDQKPPELISLINDRSFATAADKTMSSFKSPLTKWLIKLFINISWKLDATKAYNKIPEKNKMIIATQEDMQMNYKTVSLARKIPLSKNCLLATGNHGSPVSKLCIKDSDREVIDCINDFISEQNTSTVMPSQTLPNPTFIPTSDTSCNIPLKVDSYAIQPITRAKNLSSSL